MLDNHHATWSDIAKHMVNIAKRSSSSSSLAVCESVRQLEFGNHCT
jgi:hypothetical protein